MTYATRPIEALDRRTRYLCTKHGVGLKGNAWNPCWRVWVDVVQKMHLVWPPERVVFCLALGKDERMGIGPVTVVQGTVEVHYCNATGADTGSDMFAFEWFCPLLTGLKDHEYDSEWCTPMGATAAQHDAWLRELLREPTLRKLAAQGPVWKRAMLEIPKEVQENF